MKQQIFLSYAHHDRNLAGAIERELKKLGVSAFNPEGEIKPGANWRESIMEGIRRSKLVAVLWTPHAAPSNWIGYEVGSASALGKDIVVLKPVSLSARDLPSDLAGWRVLDFDPSSPAKMARMLVSSLAPAA